MNTTRLTAAPISGGPYITQLNRLLDFIESHLEDRLTLDDLAAGPHGKSYCKHCS